MRHYEAERNNPTPLRHCEQSEAIQLLNKSAYKWIATAHYIRLAMTNYPSLRAKRSNPATKLIWLPADCHGSLYSPRNDQLPVIANEVKQSSY